MESNNLRQNDELTQLKTTLISSLDASHFFTEICRYLQSVIKSDNVVAYILNEDSSATLVSESGHTVFDGKIIPEGVGVVGHIVRTKRPYFSNNISRDPLFQVGARVGVVSELAVPIAHEGVLLGTIHFQGMQQDSVFSRVDITKINAIFNALNTPIANMKMYLTAQNLNKELMKRVQEQERELSRRAPGVVVPALNRIKEVDIISNSHAMQETLKISDKLAGTDASALICGERGAGKESIAKRIHLRSMRKDNPFLTIDCSALNEDQLEVEIFGRDGLDERSGLIEAANGGTLFLQGIESLSHHMQSKILNFMRSSMATKVNSQLLYNSNVRVIAAVDLEMEKIIEQNILRDDFLYALNIVTINVPSLSSRKDDIESLATHFLNIRKDVENHKTFSPGAIKALKDYFWPGNISELRNVVERSYILSDTSIVEKSHLPEKIFTPQDAIKKGASEDIQAQQNEVVEMITLDELERMHITRILDQLGGNKTRTAKTLGITVKTLYNKLHSYGMIHQSKENL